MNKKSVLNYSLTSIFCPALSVYTKIYTSINLTLLFAFSPVLLPRGTCAVRNCWNFVFQLHFYIVFSSSSFSCLPNCASVAFFAEFICISNILLEVNVEHVFQCVLYVICI